jgi:hypothetical protein
MTETNYVCSRCGKPAAIDSRMGSETVYLDCGCDSNKVWINDGRGGYYVSSAEPVLPEEYARRHHLRQI